MMREAIGAILSLVKGLRDAEGISESASSAETS